MLFCLPLGTVPEKHSHGGVTYSIYKEQSMNRRVTGQSIVESFVNPSGSSSKLCPKAALEIGAFFEQLVLGRIYNRRRR